MAFIVMEVGDRLRRSFFFFFFFFLLLSPQLVHSLSHSLGINYGQIANNLPLPTRAVPLVKSLGATRIKLYDANPHVLSAFADSGISFTLGLGNEFLSQMSDPAAALSWVQRYVQPHLPRTPITCIAVGNEVLSLNDTSLSSHLLPAMQSLRSALSSLDLHNISVTTPHSLSVLQASYPPSAASFRKDLLPVLLPVLNFLAKANSPFLINAYPYFAYKGNPGHVSLDFVLFQPNQGVSDPFTNLHYDNMLFAQIDAVYSALSAVGFKNLPVHVSETGWPSKGDADEAGATPDNASKYNGNLMNLIVSPSDEKKVVGTPMRPDVDLSIYVFALFNENMKPGPTSERNYGIYKPDGTPAYDLAGNLSSSSSAGGGGAISGNSGISTGGSGAKTPVAPESSSTGYLSISSSASTERGCAGLLLSIHAMIFPLLLFLWWVPKSLDFKLS